MPLLQSTPKTLTALSQTVDLDVRDMDFASLAISGTFVATATFRVSNDGGLNFYDYNAMPSNAAASVSTVSAAGAFVADTRAWSTLRVIVSAFTSGSLVVLLAGKAEA